MTFAEDNKKQILAAACLTIIGAVGGYILALMVLTVWHKEWNIGPFFLVANYLSLYKTHFTEWQITTIAVALPAIGGLLLSTRMVEPLTTYGTTHWQTKAELKRNRFFANSATGFLLGKTSKPEAGGQHIVSAKFPHCLLIAPTGAGKTVGFVIPNLLTYLGSAVVLDVKGECFEKTARYRQALGHQVFRFGPRDFDMPSHRFNPLHRISKLKNPAQRMAEIDKLATLFLQAESSQAASFLPNSKDVFIACAILAFEQGNFTLGHIYKLAYGGDLDNKKKFAKYASLVNDGSAKVLFQKLANTAKDTLSAYLSVLSSSGFAPWANPHTCAVTAANDFDFREFRRSPHTVYFTVPYDDLRTIAPLVRMFFSEVIASLQEKEPGPDEPFPVMILLDEFQRIGKMPIIVDSISLLRSYGGNVAIITQSIPDLDRVYGMDDRKSIQANSGIKLYLTPSEEDTIEELSASVGTTTKKVITRSRSMKDGVFGANVTERPEEYPLLTKDGARRLPADEIVIVVNGDMPIRAKRLQYFADAKLKPLYESQDFKAPLPMPAHTITEADYDEIDSLEKLEAARQGLKEGKTKSGPKASDDIADQKTKRVKKRISTAKVQKVSMDTKSTPRKAAPVREDVEAVTTNIADLFKQAKLA